MQLGELQSQIERFNQRGVSVVALSVDPIKHSKNIIRRLGLDYSVVSDFDQEIQKIYGVQNPSTQALALHAVFIVDEKRQIFYRKVASRRPKSQELLDAIDYHYGRYPMLEKNLAQTPLNVAFPRNIFQALIELSSFERLPEGISQEGLEGVLQLLSNRKGDDAIIAFKKFVTEHKNSVDLSVAAFVTIEALKIDAAALTTGKALRGKLSLLGELRTQADSDEEISTVQKELDLIRGVIRQNSADWNLKRAKTMLRGYREVVNVGTSSEI